MALPAPPEGTALLDSPVLLRPDPSSGEAGGTAGQGEPPPPPLQCKSHSTAGGARPDDGDCSRHEPTRRQMKQVALFSRLTSTPMPDVKGMGREEADAWAAHRFAEWHRWERGDADVDVDDEA